jgi:hypothetical protein
MQTTRRDCLRQAGTLLAGGFALGSLSQVAVRGDDADAVDVCVYGATASGIMAAVAAAREGAHVLVVEPSRWLGGMTGGGLSHIDWGREEAVGGTARGILKRGFNDAQYRDFFRDLLAEHRIPVIFEHRVTKVHRANAAIQSITLDHAPPDRLGCPAVEPRTPAARRVAARVFIDCSYEGDLMARAGVSYVFGRESRDEFGESLAGAQPPLAVYDIDPYLTPGEPGSGLVPLVQPLEMKPEGEADSLTMGYGFRWKFSKEAGSLPLEPPDDYDARTFELYRRGFQKSVDMFTGRRMRKLGEFEEAKGSVFQIGIGNLSRALWAATVFGSNAAYPDGDYATRARIWKGQQDFVRGLTHFMRTDPAVTAKWRDQASAIGLQPGIFDDTAGYPHQLYVREARRMRADYVVTQRDMEGRADVNDAVGLASYGVDEWPYAMVPLDGKIALSGGYYSMLYLEDIHRGIYQIPYRAIVPHRKECENLLVPVCCSASHIAMTSIRMEPVWMILGESAGVAAAMAIREGVPVQRIDYPALREKLLRLGQRLDRRPAKGGSS